MKPQKRSKATESARGTQAKKDAAQQRGTAPAATGPVKPQKRGQAAQSSGVGGKKAKQNGVASAATGAGWCSDCWAQAQDACRGTHRLVGLATAQKDVAAEMAALQQQMDQVQQRMNAVTKAALSSAPVLVADVPGVDSTCWNINGGDVRITLASTEPLTAEDIQAVCAALEDLELEYDWDGGMPTARVNIRGLKAVMKKLPSYAKGQKCGAGDILIDAEGNLTLIESSGKSGAGAKLLGRLDKKGVDNLGACTCGEGSDCRYKYKYNSHDEIGEGTFFQSVRLAD